MNRPVNRRGGQSHIERYVVVISRQRLEVGAYLVADITVRGGSIRSDNHKINHAMLHQMAASIVDDIGMWNPVAS